MILAVITSGFEEGSASVIVTANVPDGSDILIYDDETKELIGSGTVTSTSATVTVSPQLFSGQRIIAYVDEFGKDTYGAIIVTDSDTEKSGWKLPDTVDDESYEEYLEGGGAQLPALYDPAGCRNFARDLDSISQILSIPITFVLRQIENQGGTVQVIIEDISGATGGYLTKFDSDVTGTATTKTYSTNGTYQVKVWGINQTEADAIVKSYTLTMPTASIAFGTTVVDLTYFADYGNTSEPGKRPIRVWVFSSVPVEVKIDTVHDWTIASAIGFFAPGETGRHDGPVNYVVEGEYTIRCRKASDDTQELVRQIKLNNYYS